MKNLMLLKAMTDMAKKKKLAMGGYADGGKAASSEEKIKGFEDADKRAEEETKKRDEAARKRDSDFVKGKKKLSPKFYADGGEVIGGPLREMKAKRRNPYDGNEKEADELENELDKQNFAEGGMADKKKGAVMAIVAKLAKKPMGGGEEMEMEDEEEEEGSPEHESMEMAAKSAAASEVMAAFKSGDVEALAEALTNFHKSMAYGGMAGEEEC